MTHDDLNKQVKAAAENPYFKLIERILMSLVAFLAVQIWTTQIDIKEANSLARAERAVFAARLANIESDISKIERRVFKD